MVYHHDAVVDDDAQRHRHAGEGVDMDVQAHEEVTRHRYQQVDSQRDAYHDHVPPRPRRREGEEQQDEQAEARPEIYLVQFVGDVLGVVVTHGNAYLLRDHVLHRGQAVLDVLHHRDEIGVGGRFYGQIQDVEAVDAVIGVRQGLLVAEVGQVAQAHDAPVHVLHRNAGHVRRRVAAELHGEGVPAAVGKPHQLLGIIRREGAADVRGGDARGGGLVRIEGHHPLERRLPVEIHRRHPVDNRQWMKQMLLDVLGNLQRGQRAADAVGDGSVRLLPLGVERDGRIGAAFRQAGIDVAYLRRHLEAHGVHVAPLPHLEDDVSSPVLRDGTDACAGADARQHALKFRGDLGLHDAGRGPGITEVHGEVLLRRGRCILDLEH